MTVSNRAPRIAVVGTGAIAQVVHLPILTRMRGVEVAGLFDADAAKATTLANRFSVPRVYSSIDDVWSDDSTDAVVVCTPNHLHEEQVVAGLEAGKYVLCEKPLALTSKGATRVLSEPAASSRLMVGMNQRFRPDAAALRSFVAAGDLGEIQYISAGWLNRRIGRSTRTWRHRKAGAGGGVLMDLGIQMLDLTLWLLGYPEPKRLVAHIQRRAGTEVEDSALLLLETHPHRIVSIELTWGLVADREKQYLHVVGTNGSGTLPPLRVFKESENGLLDVSPQLTQSKENQFTASYRQELAFFIEAVRNEQEIEPPGEQVVLLSIVEAAYRSAESGAEVIF